MSDTADTGQGVSVGDAVLTFLGDTTQLDVAFNRVADQAAATMGKAAASIDEAGSSFSGFNDIVDESFEKWDGLTPRIQQVIPPLKDVKVNLREAQGSAMLLGEQFGIHLPRHVSRFVATLPGVGTALEAAFSAVAVLFLIEALVKGSEKLSEWISDTFIFTQAMKDSDQAIKDQNKSLIELAAQIDKDKEALLNFGKTQAELKSDKVATLTAAIKENETKFNAARTAAAAYATAVTQSKPEEAAEQLGKLNGVLGAIALAFAKIAVEEKDVFDTITAFFTGGKSPSEMAAEAQKAGLAAQATTVETGQKKIELGLKLAQAERALTAQQIADQEEAAKKSISIAETIGQAKITKWAALATYEGRFATDSAQAVLKVKQEQSEKEYQLKLSTLEKERAAEAAAAAKYSAVVHTPQSDEELAVKKDATLKEEQLVADTNAKIEKLNADHYQKGLEQQAAANDAFATLAVAAAKRAEDAQLKSIEDFKKGELEKYVAGKSSIGAWEAAQIHATDAAAIAHETYLKRVIAVYTQQGEAQKALAAQQELEKLQLEDEAKATEKLSSAMGKLTAATKEAKEAENKLAEDTISQHFHDQEEAIKKLASMHLITEEQENDQLAVLEKIQAAKALSILDDDLKAQQKLRDEAQAKLNAAKANPASSTSELTELNAELQKEVAAVAKAQDAKLQAQEKYDKESEANDKSHYGRALTEARAYGNELLAEQLKQNHAALQAEQDELKQAKARGTDTAAIRQKITALKEYEQALEKEANGNKTVIAQELQLHQLQLLAATTILNEAKARGLNTTAIDQQILALQKLITAEQQEALQTHKTMGFWDTFTADFKKKSKDVGTEAQQMGQMMSNAAMQMDNAFASAVMGALSSGKSIGAALEQATAQVLKNLATQAMAQAIYCTAMGIAELALGVTDSSAAEWFAAAAEFGLVAGVTGAAGLAMSGGGNSHSSTPSGPTVGQTTSSSASGGGSNQTVSTTHLAEGGVVSQPTTFVAGDSKSGGSATEAVLPLSDPNAMRQVAQAIAPAIPPATPQEQSGFDPEAITRMMSAISALTGTRDASAQEFRFAEPGTGEKPGFKFSGSTNAERPGFSSTPQAVGEALGFTAAAPSTSEKQSFSPATPGESVAQEFKSGVATVGEALGFNSSEPTAVEKPSFSPGGQPSPVGKSAFASGGQATPSEKAEFAAAEPSSSATPEFSAASVGSAPATPAFTPAGEASSSERPGFTSAGPTVGEALGFKFAESSPGPEQDFKTAPPSTVGEALGFVSSEPSPSEKAKFESASAAPVAPVALVANATSGASAEKPDFKFAPVAPSAPVETPAIATAPTPTEKATFVSGGEPTASEKHGFVSPAPSSVSAAPGFVWKEPTVGEALGFTTAPPISQKSDTAFQVAAPSASKAPEFEKPAPQTVGEALGFISAPPTSPEKASFLPGGSPSLPATPLTSEPSDATPAAKPEVSSVAFASPTATPAFDFASAAESTKNEFERSATTAPATPGFASPAPSIAKLLGFASDAGTESKARDFPSTQGSAAEKQGFSFASSAATESPEFEKPTPQTVGEALGFTSVAPSIPEKPSFLPGGPPSTSAPAAFSEPASTPSAGEALGFPQASPPSSTEKSSFAFASPGQTQASQLEKPSPQTVGEALGFTSAPPSSPEKATFLPGGSPSASAPAAFGEREDASASKAREFTAEPSSPSDKSDFNFGTPSTGDKATFEPRSPASPISPQPPAVSPAVPQTVGEALGFTAGSPSVSEKSDFNFASPSAAKSPEFASAEASPNATRPLDVATPSESSDKDFEHGTPTGSADRDFISGVPSIASLLGFTSGTASATKTPDFSASSSTVGEALGFPPAAPPSPADKSSFSFASPGQSQSPEFEKPTSPTVGEALGFSNAQPIDRSPRPFTAGQPSLSEKSEFTSSEASAASTPGFEARAGSEPGPTPAFTSSSPSVGEALGFSQPSAASASEKPTFAFASPGHAKVPAFEKPTAATVGEALGFASSQPTAPTPDLPFASTEQAPRTPQEFTAAQASESEKAAFSSAPPSHSASEKASLHFAAQPPSVHEAAGFTSGEPAPGDKPSFSFAEPSESEKAEFLASQPSLSAKPGFESASSAPTVGEALGFKFDTPYPGDKPVFSSGSPSAPEKPGFSLAAPSARDQRDFAASSPSTVGEALGFSFSAPRTSYEGLGFTSGSPSATATRGFSSGVPSPHEKEALDISPPSAGERPGFNFNAPSIPREMPDMASLASSFGGLLSQPTLRAASNAQAPMAAVAGSPSATPMDMEAHMERFAERLGGQMQPEGAASGGASGDTTHVHVNVKGMISPDNLNKVVKKINRAVQNRQMTLNATNSLRVTRRSQ